jgi:hypothetical protein
MILKLNLHTSLNFDAENVGFMILRIRFHLDFVAANNETIEELSLRSNAFFYFE